MSLFAAKPQPPNLSLPDNDARGASFDATSIKSPSDKQLPKSPGASKLGSFFGWGGNTSPASSTTTFSEDKNFSPIPSPTSPAKHFSKSITSRAIPIGIDVPKANSANESFFDEEFAPSSVESESHVGEMEEELKTISAELATSIRREMELEDLVERLQSEVDNPRGPNKRTSDYFSDSGTSSVKYGGDTDSRTEEIERMQRKTDREKAQIRLDCQEKVQEERTRRSGLEKKIRRLEEKVSHVDLASMNSLDSGGRLKDLEATCEDLRRRLNDERKVKENFEDLLTALRGELHTSHNERDNLRDEVVPQLRARVEGLEAQAAEHEKLAYEHTKAQQQMQLTRGDSVRKLQTDIQSHMDSIGEDGPQPNSGLKRSTSVRNSTVTTPLMRSRPTSMSLAKGVESRDMLLERVKDVEAQRDALHRALKSLLERQEHQTKENDKRLRQLEIERDNAIKSAPKRAGYGKDVSSLRDEINTLRRRADEAIEQKWQCEKGLSGLKMDLDRAEQEIGSLRNLLLDNGVPVPENVPGSRSSANSSSLEQAYAELKKTYAASLDRVKALESQVPRDGTTDEALRSLQTSLTTAIADRDSAVSSLNTTVLSHLSTETDLASQLQHAAEHIEGLAGQVRAQLSANSTLRARLAETIKRGEVEQNANVARIMGMQGKLRTLEEALMAAQQSSEERAARHEDEVRELKESRNSQLVRVKDAIRSPRLFAPKSPMSPLFAGSARSPRVDVTSGGKAMNVGEESRVGMLKSRVEELERALGEADREMEEVVGRMNVAQIEVMELQNEREEAVRATRMLEKKVEEERLRGFEGRFKSFQT
jgi:chromosome segregation ATPase